MVDPDCQYATITVRKGRRANMDAVKNALALPVDSVVIEVSSRGGSVAGLGRALGKVSA